jgi:hypothetical protein
MRFVSVVTNTRSFDLGALARGEDDVVDLARATA